MANSTLTRTLHDAGLAAWFGGSLMGAVGLNAAAGAVDDPKQSGRVANVGWNRWTPVNAGAIGALLIGSLGQIGSNAERIAGQKGVAGMSVAKTALTAAAMGATAFQKGLGAMHALSHPVGAVCGTHHGLTNAVLMPYVLAFNAEALDERLTRLAAYIGLADPSPRAVIEWVVELRRQLGIPDTLAELGVCEGQLDRLAAMAEEDPSAGGNPLPFDAAAARRVLEAAMSGRR